MTANGKPRVAVFKMASCDGCQLQLLDAEEALLELAGAIDIVNFAEASSHVEPGPYDVTLIEGSISTPEQVEQVREIREQSMFLITIGACATSGGVQALRNVADTDAFVRTVYPTPAFVKTLERSTPVADIVRVDLQLTGCPVDRGQLLGVIASLLRGALPRLSTSTVCAECKRRGFVCVLVAKGEPCLGPVTITGCGALCPGYGRGCFGCFGPSQPPNTEALAARFLELGLSRREAAERFRFITGWAPAFKAAADALEGEPREEAVT
ncbi:MAG TPA: oxidoreductase [Actinomycetota bacterium]|nr:oxidoreductase [Actinomycetota bacterium]